jgi:hypothetical protein
MKITKREIKIFGLGMLTAFLITFLYDLKENVNQLKAGFSAGQADSKD